MKFTFLLLTVACMQISARGLGQTVNLHLQNSKIETAFKVISQQTGYQFIYTQEDLQGSSPVNCDLEHVSLKVALDSCLKGQPLKYAIEEKYVVVTKVKSNYEPLDQLIFLDINGKVVTETGDPLPGITITIKGTNISQSTDAKGNFSFINIDPNSTLVISGAEIETFEVRAGNRQFILIKVNPRISELDQVIMRAYGETTKRLNTSNISKLDVDAISRQPVSNPLAALEGQLPGLRVIQSNGYGSGSFQLIIQGQNSILQNNQPFILVDGVPLASQNEAINTVNSASFTGFSPFYTINPSDIESIEVLKDAGATAIYGSRGANGVILITTKKGRQGKLKISADWNESASKITRTMNMLNTQQYVAMRKEALMNDGLTPDMNNAADILLWDTTRYTDFKKLFLGGTAKATTANISISGGSGNTQFLLNGGYHRETTVLPADFADYRISLHSSLAHQSIDKKFALSLVTEYSYTHNNIPGIDPTQFINRTPNIKLYDSSGNLNWEEAGVSFYTSTGGLDNSNPLSSLKTRYNANFQNLNSSLQIRRQILPSLQARILMGYNTINSDEILQYPLASLDPYNNYYNQPSAYFGNGETRSWNAEPQLEWTKKRNRSTLNILTGITWQKQVSSSTNLSGSNYPNDLLLGSIAGAGTKSQNNQYSEYRYNAFFARMNWNYMNRYLLEASGRRDGSSRFGPGKQWSNFAGVGGAWIYSNGKHPRNKFKWVNFGKIKVSYGSAGNDGIGNYKFLDTWSGSSLSYQGVTIINPSSLFNPDLAWESVRKLSLSNEAELFNHHLSVSVTWFRNRSGNQLIKYSLPIQTGFSSILKNLGALVQNQGYEITIDYKTKIAKEFYWQTRFNITIPKNKLLQFPGLENSSYASQYMIGQSLSMRKLYHFTGVDPMSGLYQYEDVDGNGIINTIDKVSILNTDPSFYGGWGNNLKFKKWTLDFYFQFTRQLGRNYLATVAGYLPGLAFFNQPELVVDRWQKGGDHALVQKYSTSPNSSFLNLSLSDAIIGDASFIRCRNISITRELAENKLSKWGISHLSVYINAQNVFVITKYSGADPENQNLYAMPPLRTFAAGIHFEF